MKTVKENIIRKTSKKNNRYTKLPKVIVVTKTEKPAGNSLFQEKLKKANEMLSGAKLLS
jgi:hypothetical protein